MNELYPWLKPTYQQIINAFVQQRGHHSLLFRAEKGLGAEQLITLVAQRILCEQQESLEPCGICHSCRLMPAHSHPDFYRLASMEDKDIGVDQVREINEKMSRHAQQNGNKVVYVQSVERLTEAAANALLKTLEEPRPNSYFLLQADAASKILPTIYSRCQPWVIHSPSKTEGLAWLQSRYSAEISEISTALLLNHNRPLRALDFLQQNLPAKRKELITQFWRFYSRMDILQILPLFEKEIIFQQLDWLVGFLFDSLKAKLGIHSGWICEDFRAAVQQFAERQSVQTLLKHNQILQKMRTDLATINAVNQELILIDGLSRMLTEKEQ